MYCLVKLRLKCGSRGGWSKGVLKASLGLSGLQGWGSVASPPKRVEGGPGLWRVKSVLKTHGGSQAQAGLGVLR